MLHTAVHSLGTCNHVIIIIIIIIIVILIILIIIIVILIILIIIIILISQRHSHRLIDAFVSYHPRWSHSMQCFVYLEHTNVNQPYHTPHHTHPLPISPPSSPPPPHHISHHPPVRRCGRGERE